MKNFPVFTNNQKLVIGAALSFAVSAGSTALTAVEQSFSTGTVNVGVLIIVGLTTFGGTFATSLLQYIPSHLALEIQALKDTVAELQALMNQAPVLPSTPMPRAITLPSGKQFIPGQRRTDTITPSNG